MKNITFSRSISQGKRQGPPALLIITMRDSHLWRGSRSQWHWQEPGVVVLILATHSNHLGSLNDPSAEATCYTTLVRNSKGRIWASVYIYIYIYIYFFFFNYLFLAALGLHSCPWASPSCGEHGLLSSCSAPASRCCGFSRGTRALGARAQ